MPANTTLTKFEDTMLPGARHAPVCDVLDYRRRLVFRRPSVGLKNSPSRSKLSFTRASPAARARSRSGTSPTRRRCCPGRRCDWRPPIGEAGSASTRNRN
jgi:hypothetical protein